MTKLIKLAAEGLPPYQYQSCKKKAEGLNCEIIKKSFDLAGYKVDIEMINNDNKKNKIQNEKSFDGFIKFRNNSALKNKEITSDLIISSKVIFVTRRKGLKFNNIEEINTNNIRVGYSKYYKYIMILKKIKQNNQVEYTNDLNLLKDVSEGKIDIGIIDSRVKKHIESSNNFNNIITLKKFSFNIPINIVFSSESSKARFDFNSGLRRLIETNQYSEIIKHWDNKQ